MPARAPASIDMLQTVMRSSIEKLRITRAGVFDHVAGAAVGADLADQIQNDVLGRHAAAELAIDSQLERFGFRLQQRLRGQHVFDFAGADAEGQRPESAVRGGVAVAADDGHARLRDAEFGADDVDDALLRVVQIVNANAEFLQLLRSVSICCLEIGSAIGRRRSVVGTLWSGVATVNSGRRTLRPASRRPSNAWALVTSWTRCRSM